MKKTTSLLFLFIPSLLFAQVPDCSWMNGSFGTGNEYGVSIDTDASGNIYVTGSFDSPTLTFGTTTLTNVGSFDIFIVKYDATGNILWARSAGGTGYDYGGRIAVDASGNACITGYFNSSTLTFGTTTLMNSSSSDIFTAKYDASGNVLWATSAGGSGADAGQSIAADGLGNVYVTGYFSSPTIMFGATLLLNAGSADIFIVKYDGNGNVLWVKGVGGTGYDYGHGITVDFSGNVLITGRYNSSTISFGTTILNNAGFYDIFVVKYDGNGNVIWAISNGGTNIDVGLALTTDISGSVLLTGYFRSPILNFDTTTLNTTGNYDIFIAKYDANGNVQWANGHGGTSIDVGLDIASDASANVFVTGYFQSPTVPFDTTTLTNAGSNDIFITKYNANGNLQWVTGSGGTGNDEPLGIAVDPSGNISVIGSFTSSMLSFGTTTLTNVDSFDIFVAKFGVCTPAPFSQNLAICPGGSITVGTHTYFSSGTYVDTLAGNLCDSIVTTYLTIASTYDTIQNITIAQGDTAFVGNSFYTIQGIYADTLMAMNGCDSIIHTNLTVLMGVGELLDQPDLFIYPNPAHGTLNISFTVNHEEMNGITISNLFGQEVFSWMHPYPNKNKLQVDISNLPAGIYFIHINQDHKIKTSKLIIE
jgi:hypothetical protein